MRKSRGRVASGVGACPLQLRSERMGEGGEEESREEAGGCQCISDLDEHL